MTDMRRIRPNAGIALLYGKTLAKRVDAMHKATMYHVQAAYKRRQSEITQDASPIVELSRVVRVQRKKWQKLFSSLSETLSGWIIGKVGKRVTATLTAAVEPALPTVKFDPSRVYNNAFSAVTKENVALIKTIPQQYFDQVEAAVMRSAAAGRNMKMLADDIEKIYKVNRKRAEFIARDQTEKATAHLTRARQLSEGIVFNTWYHSHAGRKPRPKHVLAHGRPYRIDKGMKIEGEWILPGTEINCRCNTGVLIEGIDYPKGGVPDGFKEVYEDLQ